MELLGRLRVGHSNFTAEFSTVLKEELAKRTGDSSAQVSRLRAHLREQQALQEKLVAAYLKGDKAILQVFERMNVKFEEEIADLEVQIAEAEMAKASFEEVLEFSKSMLV